MLEEIYLEALERVDPLEVIARRMTADLRRRPAILIGKCAGRMAEGLARGGWRGSGLAIVPAGYERDVDWPSGLRVIAGSHPEMDERSFAAGDALVSFAAALREPPLVLISGGASACVEKPLDGVDRSDLSLLNRDLVRSGLGIEEINAVRKHLSAVKGGRLAERLPPKSIAWIWSDVPPGRPDLVGSGPMTADPTTLGDAASLLDRVDTPLARRIGAFLLSGSLPETPKSVAVEAEVLADNRTFLESASAAARERNLEARTAERQLESDVEVVAAALLDHLSRIRAGEIFVAGGEPTVEVHGGGRGGRCSELVLRVLRLAAARGEKPFRLLAASSDGIDGNSGAAGYLVSHPADVSAGEIDRALHQSDAHPLAARVGRALTTGATGNNLRDIMLMARG